MFSFKEYNCIFIFINTSRKLVHLKNYKCTKTCREIKSLHEHPNEQSKKGKESTLIHHQTHQKGLKARAERGLPTMRGHPRLEIPATHAKLSFPNNSRPTDIPPTPRNSPALTNCPFPCSATEHRTHNYACTSWGRGNKTTESPLNKIG